MELVWRSQTQRARKGLVTITDSTRVTATIVAAPIRLQYFINWHSWRVTYTKWPNRMILSCLYIVEIAVYEAINKLGFSSLKPQQMMAINAFIDRRDVFVVLPTGFGKTVFYHRYSNTGIGNAHVI